MQHQLFVYIYNHISIFHLLKVQLRNLADHISHIQSATYEGIDILTNFFISFCFDYYLFFADFFYLYFFII